MQNGRSGVPKIERNTFYPSRREMTSFLPDEKPSFQLARSTFHFIIRLFKHYNHRGGDSQPRAALRAAAAFAAGRTTAEKMGAAAIGGSAGERLVGQAAGRAQGLTNAAGRSKMMERARTNGICPVGVDDSMLWRRFGLVRFGPASGGLSDDPVGGSPLQPFSGSDIVSGELFPLELRRN